MRRRAIVGILLLAVAGCGGGDKREPTSPRASRPSLNKKQFIAKADRVCADAQRRARRIGLNRPRSPQELARTARQTSRLVAEAERRFTAIGLPAGGAHRQAERFIASVKALGRPARLLERAARQLDAAVAKHSRERGHAAIFKLENALIDLEQADNESTRIAKRYGFRDCAKSGQGDGAPIGPAPKGAQASA
jgi:hypothetical protein